MRAIEYNDYFKNRKAYLDQLWHELNGFQEGRRITTLIREDFIAKKIRMDKLNMRIKSKKNIWE
jgi:hypothetical protein